MSHTVNVLALAWMGAAACAAGCSRSELLGGAPSGLTVAVPADAGDGSCASSGATLCGDRCVDLQNDDANCGACGRACAPGSSCLHGVCTSAPCPTGFPICGGICTDVASDPANCGGCGIGCPSWDGCAQGKCVPVCPFAMSRTPASSTLGFSPGHVAIGDLDGDFRADLLVAGSYGTPDQQTLGEVDLLFNQGGGTFTGPAATRLPLPENVCGLVAAPFEGSSALDIAVCVYDSPVQIFRNDGQAGFVDGGALAVAPYPQAMTSADFNGDGKPDLAVVEQDESTVGPSTAALVTFLDPGGGGASALSLPEGANAQLPLALLAGDIDGNGRPDLVGLPAAPELRVYLGAGDGSFSTLHGAALAGVPRYGALGDVDGDGRLDLVVSLDDGSARIFRGDGAGSFAAGPELPAGPQSADIVVTDFDGDGRNDVAVADYTGGTLAVFPGLGGGNFGAPAVCYAGSSPEALASGDLDGDGTPDVVIVDYAGEVTVLLYRGRHR